MSVRSQILHSIEGLESRPVSRSSLESNLETLEPSILESKPSKEKGEISFIQHNTARKQEVLQTVLEIAFQRKTDLILIQEPYIFKKESVYYSIPHPAFNLILPDTSIRPRVSIYTRKKSNFQYTPQLDICNDSDIQILEISGNLESFLVLNVYNKKELERE